MITLMTTDAAKPTQPSGLSASVKASSQAVDGFALLITGDNVTEGVELAGAAVPDPLMPDDSGNTDETLETKALNTLDFVAVADVPVQKSPAPTTLAKGLPLLKGQQPVQEVALPQTIHDEDVSKPNENDTQNVKMSDQRRETLPQRGVSAAQAVVEGRTRREYEKPPQNALPRLPEQAISEKVKAPIPQSVAEDVTPKDLSRQPMPAPASNFTPLSLQSAVPPARALAEPVEKRKMIGLGIDLRESQRQTPTATAAPPQTGFVQPTGSNIVAELLRHDAKIFDRDVQIGPAAVDRQFVAGVNSGPPSTPTQQQTAQAVVQQLSVAVAQASGKTTEIALNPEELGRVRLTLSAGDGALTLAVFAERPETQDLLRRNIDMLAQEFRALGYQDLSFSFGGEGQAANSDEPAEEEWPTSSTMTEGEEIEVRSTSQATSGLDLRL